MGWIWTKRMAVVMTLIGMWLGIAGHVMAQSQTLYVRPSKANVRTSPAIEADNILGTLPRGTPVVAAERENDWYPVQLADERTGWMHRSVLSPELPSAAPTTPAVSASGLPVLRIGIVQDGEADDPTVDIFLNELRDLLADDYTVQVPDALRLKGDWSVGSVRAGLDQLLANPQVDLIMALGIVASQEAARRRSLSKPVFAPLIVDAELQEIPLKDGTSGVPNLSYITLPPTLERRLRAYLDIVRFKTFAVLLPRGLVESLPRLGRVLQGKVDELGLKVEIVPVDTTAESAVSALSDTIEAVLVAPQPQLDEAEFTKLVQGLIAKRLPSFAFRRADVERGLMATVSKNTSLTRLARQVALNIQRTLEGEDPSTFRVIFSPGERLTINMATVRAIGISPPWSYLTQADLLNQESLEGVRELSFYKAVEEAVNANLDLQAVAHFVAAGAQNIREARSFLFPQVDIVGDTRIIDADRAEAASGAFPERQLSGALSLFQVIYDEPTWANLSIQKDLQVSREEERNITVLDVVFEASVGYLNVLSAKTIEAIQRQNLDLTRTNLELARVRREIGVARAAEVVRWENQLANNKRVVINSFSQREQTEIILNRVLHRPSEEKFRTVEPALDHPRLITNFAKVFPYVDNPRYFDVFREFMVQEGLGQAPELRLVDAQIQAQERALVSEKRSFYSPTVSLRANVGVVTRGGEGSDPPTLALPGGSLTFPQDNNWNWEVGATASLPLFTGFRRVARRDRAREQLAQLRSEREATEERIATRIRTTLFQAGAAFANIDLAREAARAASRNYELMLDAYRQGTVTILDLLDAQTEALNANLDAANAVYVYLITLMEVQRSVGQFDFFLSASGRQTWFDKLDTFFKQGGVPVSP